MLGQSRIKLSFSLLVCAISIQIVSQSSFATGSCSSLFISEPTEGYNTVIVPNQNLLLVQEPVSNGFTVSVIYIYDLTLSRFEPLGTFNIPEGIPLSSLEFLPTANRLAITYRYKNVPANVDSNMASPDVVFVQSFFTGSDDPFNLGPNKGIFYLGYVRDKQNVIFADQYHIGDASSQPGDFRSHVYLRHVTAASNRSGTSLKLNFQESNVGPNSGLSETLRFLTNGTSFYKLYSNSFGSFEINGSKVLKVEAAQDKNGVLNLKVATDVETRTYTVSVNNIVTELK